MKIKRYYHDLGRYLKPNKALILYGPRQVGKTTLLKDFLATTKLRHRLDSGDNIRIREVLGSENFDVIREYAQGYELIAIDEAQKIPNIGQTLKIFVDEIPGIRLIATGSSSFELAGQVGEPLTGRKITLSLYPVAQMELKNHYNPFDLKNNLELSLVFGGYPEACTAGSREEKGRVCLEIADSYLLKDILEFERVKSSKLLLDLLRLLAFQVGNEVSLTELASHLGIDYKTVARYLDLFEKSFVIYNLRGFSRNLRSEITRKSKYYFYDNGIRNAVISNFNGLALRNDVGQLWENFLFMERLKKRAYRSIHANAYFWRTWQKEKIDLVEEREGRLFGYEFKWSRTKAKPLKEWSQAYPDSELSLVTRENYLDFVT
ncbi:MAG: ATP-binding protein [bacterium]